MMRFTVAGFALLLVCGCSSTSGGGGGSGGAGGYSSGGTGGSGTGGSGIGGSGIGGSGTGGSGIGGSGTGGVGTGGVGTGGSGTGGSGTGGAPPVNLVPTCSGVSMASGGTCYPSTPCNPMTSAGCTGAGSACDIGASGFECYPPPNDVALCGTCGEAEGFCVAGAVCIESKCMHYCCTDADCGSGKCYDIPLNGVTVPVKACLDAPPG
jgi:hypothetical protein